MALTCRSVDNFWVSSHLPPYWGGVSLIVLFWFLLDWCPFSHHAAALHLASYIGSGNWTQVTVPSSFCGKCFFPLSHCTSPWNLLINNDPPRTDIGPVWKKVLRGLEASESSYWSCSTVCSKIYFLFLLYFFIVILKAGSHHFSLCGWIDTHNVSYADLKLTEVLLFLPPFLILGLQMCPTIPRGTLLNIFQFLKFLPIEKINEKSSLIILWW